MSDKPTASSAADQIAPEPRSRAASLARENPSEARRVSQRYSEVSAIIANANRDLARKASTLSASLAAMNEAASIAAHNTRVDAGRSEAFREDGLQAQPDTPSEKVDAALAGSPEDAGAPAPVDPPTDVQTVANVAEETRASASAVPPSEEGHTGRGHRQKKRRLMADGSLALEPSRMDARMMFLAEVAPRSARPAKPAKPAKRWQQYGYVPPPSSTHPRTFAVTSAVPLAPSRPAPLGASKPVPADAIPSRGTFLASVDAFLTRRHGRRPKTPVFNKAELDLHVVFCEVQALGGYDTVTRDKRWKRVCEALGRDLSTATSAGHSMRILYEKFLLDFEVHLAGESGDPTAGRAAAVSPEDEPASHRGRSRSSPALHEQRDPKTAIDDEDVDDATLERLRLALRRQKAELESRLENQERRERADVTRSGTRKAATWRFEGAWLSFGDACPLFDASRAYFAQELPDLETEKPRWAQCQLCAGWRDLGDPGTRKSRDPKRQLPRSARVRARLEREGGGIAASEGGWRPGLRLGSNLLGFAEAERRVTAADLAEAAKLAADATPAAPPNRAVASPVDALALAATAIVTEVPPECAFRDMAGSLESMADVVMSGVAEEDRDMFDTEEAKGAMHDAFHRVVTAVVRQFAEHRVPVDPEAPEECEEDEHEHEAPAEDVSNTPGGPLEKVEVRAERGAPEVDPEKEPAAKGPAISFDPGIANLRPGIVDLQKVDEKTLTAAKADEQTARVMAAVMRAAPAEPAPERKPSPAAPEAPSPEAPSPEAPSPEAPSPEAPSPGAPSPGAPSPEAPSPEAPSPVPKPAAAAGKPKLKFVIKKSALRVPAKDTPEPTLAVDASEPSTNPRPREANDGGATEPELEPSKPPTPPPAVPGNRNLPQELCACVPPVPEGWSRWEAIRKKPNPNGSWAADCYYRTPAGPMGTWKTFILRSEEEICQFLKADAAQSDSVFGGLTMEFFNCKPFTRKTFFRRTGAGARADPFAAAGPVTHKWRSELVAPPVEERAATDPAPEPAGAPRDVLAGQDGTAAISSGQTRDDSSDDSGDETDEVLEDIAPTDSEDEEAAIARVQEGPLWY